MFRGSRSSTAVTPSTSVQPEKTEVSRISGTGAEVSEEHSTRASQLIERAHKRMSLSGQTPPLVRRLELIRFSYMSIGSIDCVGQSFRAQIFFELRFPGGAKDPALAASGSDMAVIDGQLRPPAGWYKGQLDLKNFIEHNEPLDSNVIKSGDDLVLSMRFEGEFFENMELESFPFDMQELSIDIAINCRPNGKLPVDLVVAQDAQIGVSEHGFALHQLYDLDARMTYVERVTGDETSSCYPTITISARVYRRPGFVIYNVIIPMAAFVIMAGMQFTIARDNQDARLAVSLTLVLTAAAYKFSISGMVPSISYLTLADKYVLSCSVIIFLLVLEGAIVGNFAVEYGATNSVVRWMDISGMIITCVLFLWLHLWCAWNIHSHYISRVKIDPGKRIATTDPND